MVVVDSISRQVLLGQVVKSPISINLGLNVNKTYRGGTCI